LSRLRRRGGEAAGDAGRARSSASSKGSVSMAPRLGLSSPRAGSVIWWVRGSGEDPRRGGGSLDRWISDGCSGGEEGDWGA
jgi:hypothetical protein